MSNNTNKDYEGAPKTPEQVEEFWRDLGRPDQTPIVNNTKS